VEADVLVFGNGHYLADISTVPDGVTVTVDDASGDSKEGFAALAMATAEHVTITIADGTALTRPLAIHHSIDARHGNYAAANVQVVLGKESRAKMMHLQTGKTDLFFLNQYMRVSLHAGANLEIDTLVDTAGEMHHLQDWQLDLAEHSKLTARMVLARGQWMRQSWDVSLAGEKAAADLAGLYAPAQDEYADVHLTVRHCMPDCQSRQLFRGIIGERSTGAWHGGVIVDAAATGSDIQQSDRNILLTETSVVHAQPHMQIHTDDVIASHGVTSGQLDQQALLYLRSRGISAEQAAELLTLAHADEVIARVPYTAWREYCIVAIRDTISSLI